MTVVLPVLRSSLLAILAAGGLFVFLSPPLQAQSPTVAGRVVDSAGEAMVDQGVALHRVTEDGGAQIARTRTDDDGRFEFSIEDAEAEAVFFAAARYENELYIGRPFRLPPPDAADHVIVVGGEAGRVPLDGIAAAGRPSASASDGARAAFAGVLVAAALLLLLGWRVHTRPPEERRVLARLARLDERIATAEAPGTTARERLREQRRVLADRLRELSTR